MTMKAAWEKMVAVYEWMADIVADYPKTALGVMMALAVAALF
jgi:hypothetical protein